MILLGVVIDVFCAGICLHEFMYTTGYKSKSKVVYLCAVQVRIYPSHCMDYL